MRDRRYVFSKTVESFLRNDGFRIGLQQREMRSGLGSDGRD